MSDDRKTKRRLIPVDIINRYSVIKEYGDLVDLEKTGYMYDLVESGFMGKTTAELFRKHFIDSPAFEIIDAITKYRFEKASYKVPKHIEHKDWPELRNRISDTLLIKEVALMVYPFSERLDRGRRNIEEKIIKAIEADDVQMSAFPEFIYDSKSYMDAPHEVKINGRIYIGWFIHATKQGKILEDYDEYADLWKDYLKSLIPISDVSQKSQKTKRQSTYEKEEERRKIYQEVVEEFGRTSRDGKLESDIIKEAAKRANCSVRVMYTAISQKK